MDDILVSISCITYNHEKYIADAIESFLMQKTNFKYEILIHDDASTDRTVEIIEKYRKKYPDIIKPIYQKENQYSKGIRISATFQYPRAKGKYIAICEGDDYWTDPYKLQKQVDYMEKHPECSMCVHAAYKVNDNTKKIAGKMRPSPNNKVFTIEEVILGGGDLFPTNSILFARKFSKLPQFYYNSPVGDYPLMIYLASCGPVYYIDEYMSVYRIGSSDSWTSRMLNTNAEHKTKHTNAIVNMLKEVDEYTNRKYTENINKRIIKERFDLLVSIGRFNEAKTGIFRSYYKSLSLVDKARLFIKEYFPNITKILRIVKRKYMLWKLS